MDKQIDNQRLSPESKQRIEAELDELRKEYVRSYRKQRLLRPFRWVKANCKAIFVFIVGLATIAGAIFAALSFFK